MPPTTTKHSIMLIFVVAIAIQMIMPVNASKKLNPIEEAFESWKTQYNKVYKSADEEAFRYGLFEQKYNEVEALNANTTTATYVLYEFADFTIEEFIGSFLGVDSSLKETKNGNEVPSSDTTCEQDDKKHKKRKHPKPTPTPLPETWDWRTQGVVNEPQDQAGCGACWAFTSTALIEAHHALETGTLLNLSEQLLVDCLGSCQGNWPATALAYTAQNGIEIETMYRPFSASDGTCEQDPANSLFLNQGSQSVTNNNVEALKRALLNSPVGVIVNGGDAFQSYGGGVIGITENCPYPPPPTQQSLHAVTVVGWTIISGQEAWIVKNSWGPLGESGYWHLSTDSTPNNGQGVCGILSDPFIVI